MTKDKDGGTGQGFYNISKKGVIESIRNQIMSREMMISTKFGLTIVIAMSVLDSFPIIMGLILAVFLVYYVLTVRKSKLEGLGIGIYMYYTPELNRQVIKLKHYDRAGVKQELFSFGVANIIYLQLLGVLLRNEVTTGNMELRLITSAVGVVVYLMAFNQTLKGYSSKVEKELTYAIEERNQGISITLTPSEKELVKETHHIKDSELQEDNSKETQVFQLGNGLEEGETELGELGLDGADTEEPQEEVVNKPLITVQQFTQGVTELIPYKKEEEGKEVTVQQFVEGESKIIPYTTKVNDETGVKESIEIEEDVSSSVGITDKGETTYEEDLDEDGIFGLFHVISDVDEMRVTNGVGKK